jgi:hypothetical protein
MRFPLQVAAKSRTPAEHLAYYRWVRFVRGEYRPPDYLTYRPEVSYGIRWRGWFFTFMDLVPTVIWRRLPVRWQTAHLFGDLE